MLFWYSIAEVKEGKVFYKHVLACSETWIFLPGKFELLHIHVLEKHSDFFPCIKSRFCSVTSVGMSESSPTVIMKL